MLKNLLYPPSNFLEVDSSTCIDEKITESTSIKDKTVNSDYSNRSSNISSVSFNENIMKKLVFIEH